MRGVAAPARVILLGFMAAGKTTVGRRLAERLDWDFVDFDSEIERRSGRSIPAMFRDSGEETFREWESRLTREYAGARHVVLAPGGGWITGPNALEMLDPETLGVWLRISPREALRRLDGDPESAARPLLAGENPLRDAQRILEERAPLYERAADLRLQVEGRRVDDIVAAIVDRVRGAREAETAPDGED